MSQQASPWEPQYQPRGLHSLPSRPSSRTTRAFGTKSGSFIGAPFTDLCLLFPSGEDTLFGRLVCGLGVLKHLGLPFAPGSSNSLAIRTQVPHDKKPARVHLNYEALFRSLAPGDLVAPLGF